MKLYPYLNFNGNCAEAVEFYEKVFGVKALTLRYSDTARFDSSYKVAEGTENWVMHSNMILPDGNMIQFCDMPKSEWHGGGNLVSLTITLKTESEVKAIFNALKDGGEVGMEPTFTFWSPCYCSLKDKFGIYWALMQDSETAK